MISSWTDNNWITITFIFMIGWLVLANFLFKKRFFKFSKPFQSKRYFVDYISITTIFHPFNIIFLIFQINFYAFLVLKIMEYFNKSLSKNELFLFLKINLVMLIFYILRYFYGKIFAFVFKMKKEQEGLSFVKTSYLAKTALYIFPLLIIFNYIDFKNGLLFLILGIYTGLILLVKYVFIMQQNQKLIFNKLFYFILYLCTLEIIPLLLVLKLTLLEGLK